MNTKTLVGNTRLDLIQECDVSILAGASRLGYVCNNVQVGNMGYLLV